jgi:hypothetical protein
MALMHRRIFHAKVGQAAPLVQHFQEAGQQMKGYGISWDTRINTDYYSGRSDQVVVEWSVNDLGEMDAEMGRIMGMPEAAAYFEAWMAKLNDMIHYAEAENWKVV